MPPAIRPATRALASAQYGGIRFSGQIVQHNAQQASCRTTYHNSYPRTLITAPRNATPLYTAVSRRRETRTLSLMSSFAANMSPSLARQMATTSESGPYDTYEAVVVGAGAAGVTAVGNLLDNRIDRILWVDDAFDGGRVNKYYREVPSNTKVRLFMDFGTGVAPFRKIISAVPSRDRWEEPSASDAVSDKPDKLQFMREMDQEKGCDLSHAADMLLILTHGLQRTPGVITQTGRVESAHLDTTSSLWNVQISSNDITSVRSRRLILATGASPTDPPLPYEPKNTIHLDLDTALSPTKLAHLLSTRRPTTSTSEIPTTVSVIGASHSAILVLRNLTTLALAHPDLSLHINWFTRHSLRYAEYEADFIARDNTGLKGEAAAWARDNLEPTSLPSSPISRVLTKIAYRAGDEEAVYRAHLPADSLVVQAIGYTRNALPVLTTTTTTTSSSNSESSAPIVPVFDHTTGLFHHQRSPSTSPAGSQRRENVIPGLYGAGIAFPERVTDRKYGHEEMNVGFGKFMKAVKKWVPEWRAVGA